MTPDLLARVRRLVDGLPVTDELAARHRDRALAWLDSTDDVVRRIRPDVPDPHLVAYVLPTDPASGHVLLLDHVASGLWLPPGGHVEPGEHPAETAAREATEELGIDCGATALEASFLTVTQTVCAHRHTDVTLWFALALDPATPLAVDPREACGHRWWSIESVLAETRIEPHLGRYLLSR